MTYQYISSHIERDWVSMAANGTSVAGIAHQSGHTATTIYRAQADLPTAHRGGPKRNLSDLDMAVRIHCLCLRLCEAMIGQFIIGLIMQIPNISIREICREVLEHRGVNVTMACVSLSLRRCGLARGNGLVNIFFVLC
jgi:hypothetical protein